MLNTAAMRLRRLPVFGDVAGIFLPSAEWRVRGVDPAEVGFRPGRELMTGEDVPVLHNVAIDIHDWREVRIVQMPPDQMVRSDRAQPVVEAVFPDPHPAEWVDALTADEIGVVVVGDRPPAVYRTFNEWLAEALVAPVQVIRWIGNEGAGTTLTAAPEEADPELEVRQPDRELARRWYRGGFLLPAESPPFEEVLKLDTQRLAALLAALVEAWSRAAEAAAASGAFTTVDAAFVASIDAAREAVLLQGPPRDDLLNECVSVAAAQAQGDWRTVKSTCTAIGSSDWTRVLTIGGFFLHAQNAALTAQAGHQGRTVEELLDDEEGA